MASYRPKSLEELNEFYDKTKSVDQAFQKGRSLLKEEDIDIETGFSVPLQTKPVIQKGSQKPATPVYSDLSEGLEDIMRTLMPDEKESQTPKQAQSITYKSEDAPIKGKELSGLMEDYVKVMTDGEYYDDEDEDDKKFSLKRRKSKKKNKYIEEASEDFAAEIEEEPDVAEPETDEDLEMLIREALPEDDEIPQAETEDAEADNDSEDAPETEEEVPTEENSDFEAPEIPNEDGFAEEESSEPSKGKRIGARIFTILLVVVFVATIVVSTLNMVLKVNEKSPAFGSKYFFTTTVDYDSMDIGKGELVVCERQDDIEDGSSVCFRQSDNTVGFGIKSETAKEKDNYGNRLLIVSGKSVSKSAVFGVIKYSVPVIGGIIQFILDNYLATLGILVLLAIVLTIIRCVAFKFVDPKFEEDEEAEQEEKKKNKKRKKKEKKNELVIDMEDFLDDTETPAQEEAEESSDESEEEDAENKLFDDIN